MSLRFTAHACDYCLFGGVAQREIAVDRLNVTLVYSITSLKKKYRDTLSRYRPALVQSLTPPQQEYLHAVRRGSGVINLTLNFKIVLVFC